MLVFSINNQMTLIRDAHILVTDEFKVNHKRYIDVIDDIKEIYELEPIELSISVIGKVTKISHKMNYLEKLNIELDGVMTEVKFEGSDARIKTPRRTLVFEDNPGLLPFVFNIEVIQ